MSEYLLVLLGSFQESVGNGYICSRGPQQQIMVPQSCMASANVSPLAQVSPRSTASSQHQQNAQYQMPFHTVPDQSWLPTSANQQCYPAAPGLLHQGSMPPMVNGASTPFAHPFNAYQQPPVPFRAAPISARMNSGASTTGTTSPSPPTPTVNGIAPFLADQHGFRRSCESVCNGNGAYHRASFSSCLSPTTSSCVSPIGGGTIMGAGSMCDLDSQQKPMSPLGLTNYTGTYLSIFI